jgi:hypothetical protein
MSGPTGVVAVWGCMPPRHDIYWQGDHAMMRTLK